MAFLVIIVIAVMIIAVVTVMVIAIVLYFSVRDLDVGMASKYIDYSLSLIETRIVFMSSICKRNSSVFY